MSSEENKSIIIRLQESLNRHDLTVLDQHPGMRGTKEFLGRYFHAFPDAQATIEELVAEGEWVAARLISRGTHQHEEWGGQAPIGRPWVVEVLALHRIVDDRIVLAYAQAGPMDGVA
jgi:predicted ester cyclase